MDLINYISDKILERKPVYKEFDPWNVRLAVRAVLLNNENQVALMYIAKYDVYKLPGGGVDEDENLGMAFAREMLEETGCEVEKVGNLGITIEKRDEWRMFQVSHCYLARVTKVQGLELTDGEKEEEFSLHWVKNIDEAIRLVGLNKSSRYDNKYIKARDLAILKKAKEFTS